MSLPGSGFTNDEIISSFVDFMEPNKAQLAIFQDMLEYYVGDKQSPARTRDPILKRFGDMHFRLRIDSSFLQGRHNLRVEKYGAQFLYVRQKPQEITPALAELLPYLGIFIQEKGDEIIIRSTIPTLEVVFDGSRLALKQIISYAVFHGRTSVEILKNLLASPVSHGRGWSVEDFLVWRDLQAEEQLILDAIHNTEPPDRSLALVTLANIQEETEKLRRQQRRGR